MAYIYVITNDINDKVYVGKTNLEIKQRFKQHINDCSRQEEENRPLYRAMMKYGTNHFFIRELEKVFAEEAPEREQYWISYYDSYHNGYNATLGGDGKCYLDYQEILRLCDETLLSQAEIAKQCNCCTDSVRNIARQYRPNINWHTRLVEQQISQGITIFASTPVRCIETQELFVSCTEAGKWLVEQGKIKSVKSGKNHVSEVCQGHRQTVGGYHWEYANK